MREECGVFALLGNGEVKRPAEAACLAMFALQHRGQESCGVAISDMGVITCEKGMGLAGEVFTPEKVASMRGQNVIAHVRYSGRGFSSEENTQPLVMRYAKGRLAIALNGALTNSEELKKELAEKGAMFRSGGDPEIIAQLIARERLFCGSIEEAVKRACDMLRGCYSFVVMSPRKIIAARDPHGFRPLCAGLTSEGSYCIASESCALPPIGADFVRDIMPGEIAVLDGEGLSTYYRNESCGRKICIFEYVYFARPDSVIDGISIHASRVTAGRLLARQHPVEADLVIGVPDSGLDAAVGYARESGIEYGYGFVRNPYVGRTFIKPTQDQRANAVNIKLNVLKSTVAGKRIVMVDDSIVRGTTSADIIKLLKQAGAAEVHVRICSPTIHHPCLYGTDIPTREELTSNHNTVEQLCRLIGADSLGFLAIDSLAELIDEGGSGVKTYCDACFTGNYPEK